jgi:putative heme-binding domain-containing protein
MSLNYISAPMKTFLTFTAAFALTLGTLTAADANQTAILSEALARIPANKINEQPELKAALTRVLDASKGTAEFVDLVQRFKVTDRNPDLLELAIQKPNDQLGVEALRALFANNGLALVQGELAKTNVTRVVNLVDATGNVGGKNAETLLLPLITDTKRDVTIRRQALKGVSKVQPGAQAILKLAKEDKLPADLRFVATTELKASRFPNIQKEAAEVLPPPLSGNAQPLPPVSQLITIKGDVKRGEGVFFRVQSTCANCHIVNGQGKDFGPALSEIGTKLGKDALYESILEPSAGISFGYESWEIMLKNGDELYGLIVSETGDSLSIKDASGLIRKIAKNDLKSRQTLKLSIMPAGLQMTMTTQELVDLVEYLASLKKK